jgi:hypothetical protein
MVLKSSIVILISQLALLFTILIVLASIAVIWFLYTQFYKYCVTCVFFPSVLVLKFEVVVVLVFKSSIDVKEWTVLTFRGLIFNLHLNTHTHRDMFVSLYLCLPMPFTLQCFLASVFLFSFCCFCCCCYHYHHWWWSANFLRIAKWIV